MDETTKTPNVQDEPLSAPAQGKKAPEAAQSCCGCAQQDGQSAGCGGCCCAAQPEEEIAQEAVLSEDAPQDTAEKPVEKTTVVDIRFRNNAKTYFFDPGELKIRTGDHVIMDTSRGVEYGVCAAGNHDVPSSEIVPPLRKILRLANAQDERVNRENQEKEKRAFGVCMQKIEERKLEMQLVSAECAFDGSKILFFFTADGRVDFRELVKDLASVFRTRIELRQIGVRDKAKMVGGLGMCGRPFCCREFLDDFQPVSIKMAKTQNLSLNPTKISGVCGRLMCCLKYEQEAYEDLLRTAPKNESFVDTPDGRGTVTEVNLLRQSVKVRMEDHPETIGSYKNCDICVLRNGKARKNDPPIPKDLAPISSKPRPAKKLINEFEPLPEVIYPDDVAVVDRAPQMDAVPQVQNAPEQESGEKMAKNRHRRRGRGKGGAKPAGETETRPAQEPKPQPQQAKPRAPQERRAPKPQQSQPPQQQEKPAAEGGEGGGQNRRRRRYRGHRGGGGGEVPKAE